MAELHEARARELLTTRNPDGWIDLYAAITAHGEAGRKSDAKRLVSEGRQLAMLFSDGHHEIERQLAELERWLDSLRVVPSLGDFSRLVPVVPVTAA